MTPVTYDEATAILGVTNGTLKHAIGRGVLTKLPREGLYQRLIKEQVELFRGKRLSLSSLSNEDRNTWEKYDNEVNPLISTPVQEVQTVQPVTMPLFNLDRSALEYLNERGLTMTANTPIGSTSFHSALAEKPDNNQTEIEVPQVSGLMIFIVILLGLIWLLNQTSEVRRAAIESTERIIREMGLEKQDPIVNQKKTIDTLKKHPREAKKLKAIIDSAGYQNPLKAA